MEIRDKIEDISHNYARPLLTIYAPEFGEKGGNINIFIDYHRGTSLSEVATVLSVIISSTCSQMSNRLGESSEQLEAKVLENIKENIAYNHRL